MPRNRFAGLPVNGNANANANTKHTISSGFSIENMYETENIKRTRKLSRNSKLTKKERNSIIKRITNNKVSRCKTKCASELGESGGIGICVKTNTHIGLKDCTQLDSSGNPKTIYHYIRPCELAVDTLQYAIDTGKTRIITESQSRNAARYLAFDDFPTLQVETVSSNLEGNGYIDTRRDEGFYLAYEDAETLANPDAKYEKQLADYNESYATQGPCMYKNHIKYQANPSALTSASASTPDYTDGTTAQNIQYVKDIAESLTAACDFTTESLEISTANRALLKCDLAGIDDKYIIRKLMKLEDDEEYVICGYPDPTKMRTSLALRENEESKSELSRIHAQHRIQFALLFAELHNSIQELGSDSTRAIDLARLDSEIHKFMKSVNISYFEDWIKQNEQLDPMIPGSWVNSDDFKSKIQFLRDNGLGQYADYIEGEIASTCLSPENRAEQLANIPKVKEAFATYVNHLLLEYLNKPMTRIRYYFQIFHKVPIATAPRGFQLHPLVFNIKQLKQQHKPLLDVVLELIQTRIPAVFGILEGSLHQLEKYKLFHSYVNYGDFFYITTEYLHTMSNITHYAYKFENSIELEELIYSLSRGAGFWQNLKIEYQIKKHRVLDALHSQDMGLSAAGVGNSSNAARNTTGMNSRGANSKGTYSRRTNPKGTKKNARNSKRNTVNSSLDGGTVLMIYEKHYQEYIVIYRDAGSVFRVLELKSNMSRLSNEIINAVARDASDARDSPGVRNIYSCANTITRDIRYSGPLFRIVAEYIFTEEQMKVIKRNNPLIVKVMKKPNTDTPMISIHDMIKTELLDNTKILKDFMFQVVNVAFFKPIIYFNCYMNPEYLDALLNYIQTGKRNTLRLYFENIGQFSEKYGIYGDSNTIINPDKCGYNILEVGDKYRKVIWILPCSNENEYLRNFTSITQKHMPLLEAIKKLYVDKDHLCFLHIQSTHIYGTLHFHITRYDDYNLRVYPLEYQGSSIIKEININQIINYVSQQPDYYSNYSSNLLNLTI